MRKHATSNRIAAVLGLALLAMSAAALAQDDACEIPLFVRQGQGTANVMVICDNSFSMNEVILHEDYDKDVRYKGPFDPDATYFVAKDGVYAPDDFDGSFPSAPLVPLVNSDNGEDGRYPGNYMNWIYGNVDELIVNATPEQILGLPQITRIQVLKATMQDVINRSARLNMALSVFSKTDDGANIVGQFGKSHTAMQSIIDGITANAHTPSGETLEDVMDMFGDKNASPMTTPCENNFIIFVTDGLPTYDVDVSAYLHDADGDGMDPGDCASIGSEYDNSMDCSDHMDDVAWWMANEDVNPYIEDMQNVYTYVVGYSTDSPLLRDTAENGNGLFFLAENANELSLSIEYAMQDILRRISAGSAVAVVSTERGTEDRLYRGKFMPIDWDGFLEAFRLPYEQDDEAMWEGGQKLAARSASSREIYTALEDTPYKFVDGNAGVLRDAMGAVDDAEAADLINWGRGEYVDGYRDRHGWKLGPIIHSTPVVVGPPAQYRLEDGYSEFQNTWQDRRKMVYVGANDGMMHAFDAETGDEDWAFVPEFALPEFATMADSFYCHVYTCDQTVTVNDVMINGSWRTILTTGGGHGGSGIFAMDVTNPDSPKLLWQETLPNDKDYHSEIKVAMIGGYPVALVGSGMDQDSMQAFLYCYDMNTGDLLGEVKLSEDGSAVRNMATRPAMIDKTLDGSVDLIYIGDMLGSIYRFETNGSPKPGNWTMTELYEGRQEITADPVVAYAEGGAINVYFGTGAYIHDSDMDSANPNSFLCVFDNHSGNTVTMATMANQTSVINDVMGFNGWYVNLWHADNERVTQQAAVVAETVVFTSFAPSDDVCVAGGTSWLYQMRYNDGGNAGDRESDSADGRDEDLGEGIASYPVVDLSAGEVVVQSSNAEIEVAPIQAAIVRMSVRAWRETFDGANAAAGVQDPTGTGDIQ